MSSKTREEHERKMLQRVGILKKQSPLRHRVSMESLMFDLVSHFVRTSLEEENPLVKRIENLEREVRELRKKREIAKVPSKADLIYLKFKEELEQEHFGKIVAIDVDSGKIVGIGSSILEAYSEAKKNTSKKQFSYRRVGFDFVHRL